MITKIPSYFPNKRKRIDDAKIKPPCAISMDEDLKNKKYGKRKEN